MSNEEKERRFYERPEKMVGIPVGYSHSVPVSLAQEVAKAAEAEQAQRVGLYIKKKVYDPYKGYKVSRVVPVKSPVLFSVTDMNELIVRSDHYD